MRETLSKSLPPTYNWREYPRQLKLSTMEVIENEFTEALLDFFEEQQNQEARSEIDSYPDEMMQDMIDSHIDSYAD